MLKKKVTLLLAPLVLLISSLPGVAQHNNFNRGVERGGRGGRYYHNQGGRYDGRYDDRYRQPQGGIGPGKGALIGAAGGAVLGAILGGGLKGSIVGGAAGAGIGAVVGQANQNNRRDNYYRR